MPLGRLLPWQDVDLAAGLIHVERGWDEKEGPIRPKTAKGRRKIPIAAAARDYLVEHRMMRTASPNGISECLVFGAAATMPFTPSIVTDKAWKGLQRITLHEARHTFASLMIARSTRWTPDAG